MSIPSSGLLAHLLATFAAASQYLAARFQLLLAESKEAGISLGIVLGLAAGALCLALFGYFFLVITLVFAIAAAFDNGDAWIWVAAAAALFHFGVGAGLAYIAYLRIGRPLFPLTISELEADSLWLKQMTKKP